MGVLINRFALAGVLLHCGTLYGDTLKGSEETDLEQVLMGFDEEPNDDSATATAATDSRTEKLLPSWLDIDVRLVLASSFNVAHAAPGSTETDHRGLSRLRPQLDAGVTIRPFNSWRLEINGHLFYDAAYAIRGRDDFTEEVIAMYELEPRFGEALDEAYIQGSILPNLDIKVGRQVVAWGTSENIRVTDILNPLDNREPGVVDLEHLRLPVVASKLDLYLGDWNLSGIVLHEVRFNKDPVFGSDFYPGSQPPPDEEELGWSAGNQEVAMSLRAAFSGWDLSLYGAYLFDEQKHVERIREPGLEPTQLLRHSRVGMAGLASAVAWGSWLLRGEAALLYGLELTALPGEKKTRLDLLVGLTYSGFSETIISFEAADRHLFGFEPALGNPPDSALEDDLQFVLRVTRELMHDRLMLTLLLSSFGVIAENGGIGRFDARFAWTDTISTVLGLVLYRSGDKPNFVDIGDNDRIFAEISFSP